MIIFATIYNLYSIRFYKLFAPIFLVFFFFFKNFLPIFASLAYNSKELQKK